MRTKRRRFLEIVLLLGGVAGLGIWCWSVAREGLYEDWQNWVFDRQTAGESASAGEYIKQKLSGDATTRPTEPSAAAASPHRALNSDVLGRLRIPRLKLEAIVREGTADKTLSLALGHIAGTAKPGQNGTVAVAGHRDSLFRGLRNIRINDRILFETSDGGTYTYQVNSTTIVKPTDVSVLKADLYPELTLVTCYPFNYVGSAPDRFIVKARQVGQMIRETPVTEIAEAAAPAPPTVPPIAPPAPHRVAPPIPIATRLVPIPYRQPDVAGAHRVPFDVATNHSRQLAPGISIGLTRADPQHKTVDGWMWVMTERRTIWLRDQSTRQPIPIHGADGHTGEVVIDSVTSSSMHGYLVL